MEDDGWNTPRQLIYNLDFFGLKKQSSIERFKFNIFHFFRKLDRLNIFSYFLDNYSYTIDSDNFLNSNKNIFFFLGYWKNLEYLKPAKADLVTYLSQDETLEKGFNTSLGENVAMIHIRRGDFIKDNRELNAEYYIKSISYMKKNNINIFDVFTDDEDWVKDQSFYKDVRNIYSQQSGKDEEYKLKGIDSLDDREETIKTFGMMISYDNFVVGNSSFAFWAAYLKSNNNSLVTMPNPLFKNESREDKNDKRDKLYSDNWYLIQNK